MVENSEDEKEEKKNKKRLSGGFIVIIILTLIVLAIVIPFSSPVYNFFKARFSEVSGPIKEYSRIITHPEEKITKIGEWKAETKAVEKEKPRGVKISDFRAKGKVVYNVNEPVELTSNVEVYGLEDRDTKVKFMCESGDKKGVIFISGNLDNEIFVSKNENEFASVNCKFAGFSSGEHKVKLKANYEDFASRGELKIYNLEKEKLDNLRLRNMDVFNFYSINEPLLNKEKGNIKSEYGYGPLILTLSLNNKQPIDEEGIYELYINIKEDSSWKGKIDKIKYLSLILPDTFGIDENCAFGNDLRLNENELTEEKIKELKKGLEYWCSFKVNEISEELTFSTIKLQVSYDYIFEKETTVQVKTESAVA